MDFYQVAVESHGAATTIYVSGFLAQLAAARVEEIVAATPENVRVLRIDLRGVELIDPSAFVIVARTLGRWRDATRGRVCLQFPERSARRHTPPVALYGDQRSTMGSAVSRAMSWPMSTSPG